MAKINSETLLRGDYLLPQKCNIELESGSLTTWLLVPLPLPTPGSAPVVLYSYSMANHAYMIATPV